MVEDGPTEAFLVVDDDGDVRDVIVEILQSENYRVSSAASGALMRDFLETADVVDCVVLDATMPGEGSISLALHLKGAGIPVVMISGSHEAMEYARGTIGVPGLHDGAWSRRARPTCTGAHRNGGPRVRIQLSPAQSLRTIGSSAVEPNLPAMFSKPEPPSGVSDNGPIRRGVISGAGEILAIGSTGLAVKLELPLLRPNLACAASCSVRRGSGKASDQINFDDTTARQLRDADRGTCG